VPVPNAIKHDAVQLRAAASTLLVGRSGHPGMRFPKARAKGSNEGRLVRDRQRVDQNDPNQKGKKRARGSERPERPRTTGRATRSARPAKSRASQVKGRQVKGQLGPA